LGSATSLKAGWNFRHPVLIITAAVLLGFGKVTGQSLPYYNSSPVSGSVEAALTPEGMGDGDFVATFGTLTETLYYDSAAQTLQAERTVTLGPNVSGQAMDVPEPRTMALIPITLLPFALWGGISRSGQS